MISVYNCLYMNEKDLHTQCCIAGGGPAGIMLGYLLARAGIDVVVLEKWPDFFRDFRGDTIHPSTMNILNELGLLDDFLKLPIQKTYTLVAHIEKEEITMVDFAKTKMNTPFIAFLPQWDFLNFMVKHASTYPHFHIHMETEAVELIREKNKVTGVIAQHTEDNFRIYADLVVGADGRHSTVREKAGFKVHDFGAPMDVLWFRMPREQNDGKQTIGTIEKGHMMIMIERGDYWQCGFVIPKGRFEELKAEGLAQFHARIAELAPFLGDRARSIKSWDEVKSLVVTVDRLTNWAKEGVVCIGDAAHAMSPIGGVGINLAIQDAVAAANVLVPAFKHGKPTLIDLYAIQKRRMFPVKATQFIQLKLQNQLIAGILKGAKEPHAPLLLRSLQKFPSLRKYPAYFIGIGVRPEHVATKKYD